MAWIAALVLAIPMHAEMLATAVEESSSAPAAGTSPKAGAHKQGCQSWQEQSSPSPAPTTDKAPHSRCKAERAPLVALGGQLQHLGVMPPLQSPPACIALNA